MRSKSGGKWQRLKSHWLAVVYLCDWFPNWLAEEWELLYTELSAFDSAGPDTGGSRGRKKSWMHFPFYFKVAGLQQSRSSGA